MTARSLSLTLAAVLAAAACGSSTGGTGTMGAGAATTSTTGTTMTTAAGTGAGTGTGGGSSTGTAGTGGGSSTGTAGTGGGSSTGAGGACTTQPTFTQVLAKPLSGCSGFEPPCHNGNQANLTIDPQMKAATWAQLVNVPTFTVGAGVRVVPGDPAHSFLYRKLIDDLTPSEGSPMPKNGLGTGWTKLPANEIEMVRCWILAGAKDN